MSSGRKDVIILGVAMIVSCMTAGCDIAREVLHPTRYAVSCMDEKNREIATFRCNQLSVSQGLVILDDCEDSYKDKAVVLACPVLVVKDNQPKATKVFDNRDSSRKQPSGPHEKDTD